MRMDHNYIKFIGHYEWYTHEPGHVYVPTDKCPEDVKKAMDSFNSYTYPEEYAASKKANKA